MLNENYQHIQVLQKKDQRYSLMLSDIELILKEIIDIADFKEKLDDLESQIQKQRKLYKNLKRACYKLEAKMEYISDFEKLYPEIAEDFEKIASELSQDSKYLYQQDDWERDCEDIDNNKEKKHNRDRIRQRIIRRAIEQYLEESLSFD